MVFKKWGRQEGVSIIEFRQTPYIIDFCATKQKLIIEVDGSQHMEQDAREQARIDFLEHAGYKVLRFWNNQILDDIEAVLDTILSELAGNKNQSEAD